MARSNTLNPSKIKEDISSIKMAYDSGLDDDWLSSNLERLLLKQAAYDLKKSIADTLSMRRESLGLSLWQLGDEAGLQSSQVKGIEDCSSNYAIDSLVTILAALNLKIAIIDDNTSISESPE